MSRPHSTKVHEIPLALIRTIKAWLAWRRSGETFYLLDAIWDYCFFFGLKNA